jgi:ferredoxin-type protein NapH
MTIKAATRSQPKKRVQKASYWPKIRFFVTLAFFLLIGSSVWVGSSCAIGVGGMEIACPLGVVQVMVAARQIIPALLLGGLGGILLIVIFGRAFCSWICPGRWIFNRGPAANSKPGRVRTWMQRAVIGGVIGASFLCHTPVFCVICPAGVVCRGAIAAGTGGSILPTIGWLGTLIGIEWTTGRSFCRDMCPLGTMFGWLSRLNPFFKFKADPEKCIPCQACSRACPEAMNLSQEDLDLSRCSKCFACQTACPRDAIELKVIS